MLWRIENADLRPAIEMAKQLPTSGWKEANEAADQAMHGWIAEIHHACTKLTITRQDIDIDFATGVAVFDDRDGLVDPEPCRRRSRRLTVITEQLALLQWYAIYKIAPDQAPVAGDVLPLALMGSSA